MYVTDSCAIRFCNPPYPDAIRVWNFVPPRSFIPTHVIALLVRFCRCMFLFDASFKHSPFDGSAMAAIGQFLSLCSMHSLSAIICVLPHILPVSCIQTGAPTPPFPWNLLPRVLLIYNQTWKSNTWSYCWLSVCHHRVVRLLRTRLHTWLHLPS